MFAARYRDNGAGLLRRIVVYGKTMLNAVVRDSAKPFDFQRAFRLSDEKVRATRALSYLGGEHACLTLTCDLFTRR